MQIRCPGCNVDYDVSGRPAGTLVSCHCGETFGLARPAAAPLALSCPGCGAPADPGAPACQYCAGALKSVCCPNCFTLLFEGARHCAQCGTAIAAPALAVHRGGGTALPCARCASPLTASLVGNHLFDRCDQCGGLWAHHLAIDAVFRERGQKYDLQQWLGRLALPARTPHDRDPDHAACPDCERRLSSVALAEKSGLVVDICHDHGIWFDYRELRTLVARKPGETRPRTAPRRRNRGAEQRQSRSFLDDDWWPWEAIEDLIDLFD